MEPLRVLHFPGIMTEGGVESLLMNWYRNIDRTKIQFDFCVTRSVPGPLDYEIKSLGGRIIYIPTFKKSASIHINSLVGIIKDNGPYDVVHIHSTHLGVFSLIASKKVGVKNRIYHVHSTKNLALRKIPFKGILEYILGKKIQSVTSTRLACSIPAGEFVYGKKDFEVINNAIDLSEFSPIDFELVSGVKKNLNIPSDAIVVGNVARFVPGKNQDLIVKMIAKDKTKKGRLFGLFVGDGTTKIRIENLSKELNCTDRILFVGRQNNTSYYYNCMDVFCLPSDFEGLGMVAVEAQACGIPCLVSNGIPDDAKMGNAPFEKCDLNDNINKWIETAYSLENKRVFDKDNIVRIITERGYNLTDVVKQIQRLYVK